MHIAYLTTEYPPLPTGGIGTSIQNLARELIRQGHQATVIGLGNQQADWEDEGVKVRFIAPTRIPKIGWWRNRQLIMQEVNYQIEKRGVNIIEAPDWCGLSASMKFKVPLVIRCHGSDSYFGNLLGYQPRWSVRIAERLALRGADEITAVSQFAADVTKKIFGLTKPIHVIHNGVDLQKFHNAEEPTGNSILYFGTLVRKKGVLDLAHIFSLVAEKNSSSRLMLAGRDADDKKSGADSTWRAFKQQINPNALNRVEYVGAKNHEELSLLIQKAAVCVFPSYAEAMPLAWMEAMACGKAVVASNIGWASEIIEDGVSGILIHPSEHTAYANAIVDLLDNPTKRISMGIKARERVEQNFSIQRVAKLLLDWYRDVINA